MVFSDIIINTIRTKYHANQTKDMCDAMKIFKQWLKSIEKVNINFFYNVS